jgi:6-pyruvoyltetrahydropterin/6-carboxytetrahydropterin synthase
MLMDFADIDRVARPIIDELDHSNLNDLLKNPTSELLAVWMLRRLRSLPNLFAVQVAETERSSCMVTMDDAACVMHGAEGGLDE